MQSFLMRLHMSIYIIYIYNKVDIHVRISQQRDGVVFVVNDSVTVMPQTGGSSKVHLKIDSAPTLLTSAAVKECSKQQI